MAIDRRGSSGFASLYDTDAFGHESAVTRARVRARVRIRVRLRVRAKGRDSCLTSQSQNVMTQALLEQCHDTSHFRFAISLRCSFLMPPSIASDLGI